MCNFVIQGMHGFFMHAVYFRLHWVQARCFVVPGMGLLRMGWAKSRCCMTRALDEWPGVVERECDIQVLYCRGIYERPFLKRECGIQVLYGRGPE